MATGLPHRFRLIKKIALIVSSLIALYALVGFIVAPYFLKSNLISRLSDQLHRPVKIDEVRLNPFALSLFIKGFEINEHDNTPLLGFGELYVNVQSSSLVNRALTFDEIRLKLPYGVVKIHRDGTLNVAQLGSGSSQPEKESNEQEAKPESEQGKRVPPVIIDLLEVEQGIVEFHDEAKPTPYHADIVPIHFTLRKFRTQQDTDNDLDFTAELGPGEILEWQGNLSVEPLRSDGHVALTGLKLRSIWDYLRDQLHVEITDGVVDLKAPYHFETGQQGLQAVVRSGEVSINNFALREKGIADTLISIPAFRLGGIDVDIPQQTVAIDSISSKDANIKGLLYRDGTVNYQKLFVPGPTPKGEASKPVSQGSGKDTKKPWSVTVREMTIENYAFMFEDQGPEPPAQFKVDGLTLQVHDLRTQPHLKTALDLSLRFNESGRISTTGSVTTNPLVADFDVNVSQLPFAPFQPYVEQKSQVALKSGGANLHGHIRYRAQSEGEPLLHYQGTAGITGFALTDKQAQDLLKWDSLSFNSLSLDVQPTRVTIAEILLKKPYAKVMIGPDKSFNISTALKQPNTPSQTPPSEEKDHTNQSKTADSIPVRIDIVRIVGGSTHFADLSITPKVSTKIEDLNGTINGLSSKELARADVRLEGKVDKYAPVKITGQINPLSSDAFTDLSILFRNVELTSVSPYSAKYAGYPITKGKLSLDLRYNLSKKHLEAENKVLIDQLTLGAKVESPDATSLPVKLALALVTDRKGQIDIDLPVRGNLNDPDFHYGRLILQVLGNLMTKAVTSPFAALGSLMGGKGEELSEVEFPPGSAALPTEKEDPVKSLAKALEERPALRVDITGTADPASDRAALAEVKLREDLKLLKLKEMNSEVKRPSPQEEIELIGADEERFVKDLYRSKFGQEPNTPIKEPEKLDTQVVEVLKGKLLETYEVEEADLRRLAQERAEQVRDHLIAAGVSPEQVFILDAAIEPVAKSGHVPTKLALAPK